MSKPADRASNFPVPFSGSAALALTIACVGALPAVRCVLDGMQGDKPSLAVGLAFLAVLAWRGWSAVSRSEGRYQDVVLLPAAILWSTWMAYRGVHFVSWWLPVIPLVVFLAPPNLVFALLSISVVLTSTSLFLGQDLAVALQIGTATVVSGLCAALYRWARSNSEIRARSRVEQLDLVLDAARLCYAELGERAEVTACSKPLALELGHASDVGRFRLTDLVHPNDHLWVTKAHQQAMTLAAGVLAPSAACDCRLMRSDGSSSWAHAQFVNAGSLPAGAIVTFTAIDDRMRAEEALRESQRKLAAQALELTAQFDAAKTALHARQEVERLAQHDLRSPLRSIEAAAALLRKGRVLSTNEEQLLTSIEWTAARALAIVTMSLDLYRMEEGTFRFEPDTVDLVTIGRSVIAELAHHARSKNVRLDFDGATSSLRAVGNQMLTTSVVENLVRNALEAAPEHSAVTLSPYQGARVGLLIHNDGEVPTSIRDNFFEKYVTHGKRGGLGLGTYSARLVARAQGGDLTMTSSAEKGTLLIFKLQRSSAASGSDAAGSDTGSDRPRDSIAGALFERPASTSAPNNKAPLDLLIVEDDDHNWLLLLSWLPGHVGARRAVNGREAIDALTMRRPDLVVMDLEMPVMDGFEALSRIRAMQSAAGENASVVFAFTGYDDPHTLARIHDAGFDGVLPKPVRKKEFDQLMAAIGDDASAASSTGEVWVEKKFVEAFPAFVESRRALVNDIERAALAGDANSARRAAHTLAGSPAIHGFDAGIGICRQIVALGDQMNPASLSEQIAELRRLLSNPAVR
jgi:signal transduction histidine kinase/HPt (histidine-containing phosphotransfer) domain-containing protein